MNVYRVEADLACGTLVYAAGENDYADRERCREAMGKPSAAGWHPPSLRNPPGKIKILPVDCVPAAAFGGQAMLLNQRAREALAPLLLSCGEYLPVRIDGLDYRWFNCTALVDVADQDRIEGRRSTESYMPPGWWDRITRWAFHPERLAEAPAVFTVPQRRRILMCTDVLREAVEAHGLLGFQFDPLWSPETGGVEVNDSPTQFLGEAGRRWTIAAKARRKAIAARLEGRLVRHAEPGPGTAPSMPS